MGSCVIFDYLLCVDHLLASKQVVAIRPLMELLELWLPIWGSLADGVQFCLRHV